MKILGIGLSKTGTTSLAHALEILGYKTPDYPGIEHYSAGDLTSIEAGMLETHDALTDTPIPSFYRELDARYPGAKFILTIRDAEGWLKSCKKQFTEKLAARQNEAHNQLFMDLYGCTVFDEQKFLAGYEKFVSGVLEYFKNRPQDLLVINVVAGEGWEKLCPFLGKPVPEIPFPKANVTEITWMNIDDIVAVARRAGRIALRGYQQRQTFGTIGKILYRLRGGDAGALQRASREAHEAIVDGLKKLNAQTAVLAATWQVWSRRSERRPAEPVRIVPFTADGGWKFAPRLSPDGERVAYTWNGGQDSWHVYVKGLGRGTKPLRLTDHPAGDFNVAWSPDGRQIAFLRHLETGSAIYTVPSLGGQERRLIDVAGPVNLPDGSYITVLSWSPDGEWLGLSEKASRGRARPRRPRVARDAG